MKKDVYGELELIFRAGVKRVDPALMLAGRSEEHTSELQSH